MMGTDLSFFLPQVVVTFTVACEISWVESSHFNINLCVCEFSMMVTEIPTKILLMIKLVKKLF